MSLVRNHENNLEYATTEFPGRRDMSWMGLPVSKEVRPLSSLT